MDFHKITLEKKDWIIDRLAVDKFYGAEYCFSNMYHWQENYGTTIAEFEGFAVMRSGGEETAFCYFGDGDRKALIAALEQEAEKIGQPLRLYSILEKEKQRLEEAMPGKFRFEECRDSFDYCYTWEKLAELKGRKLSKKRNHVKQFINNCPDWAYEPITEENMDDCRRMAEQWYKNREEATGENLDNEKFALFKAMDHFHEENLIGGLLRVNGTVEAFTMGYPVSREAIVVHFEKANLTYPGCYPMINQQFVMNSCRPFALINREEDMGHDNLRQAKLSYYPDELLVKYDVTLNKE